MRKEKNRKWNLVGEKMKNGQKFAFKDHDKNRTKEYGEAFRKTEV